MASMNRVPLESAKAKLNRALENLQLLDGQIFSTEKDTAHGIAVVHQRDTDELVVTVATPHQLFVRIAILAGEVIHQARSALDHAVWALVPKPNLRTAFPVFIAETKVDAAARGLSRYYDQHARPMIDGISPAAGAVIKGVQPFGSEYRSHLLYILNELWNKDKHRLLNTCMVIPLGVSLIYSFPDGRFASQMMPVPGNVEYGTEIFRERHPGKDVGVLAEVARTSFAFTEGVAARQPVSQLLNTLMQFAFSTVAELAKTV
jgi:hypothetical protein